MFWQTLKKIFGGKVESSSHENFKELYIFSPISGQVIGLEKVPDTTFSEKMVGDGIAVLPSDGRIFSPVDGQVIKMFHTHHACVIQSSLKDIEVLIHLGIDTVKLQGKGFNALVKEGDHVRQGAPIIDIDLQELTSQNLSLVSPIIISKLKENEHISFVAQAGETVEAGQSILMKI